jgi:non-ribosomal peptide synthetase component F
MDKSSLSIIFRELFTLYLMGVDNVSLPGLHYSDFSDWLFRTSDVRAQLKNEQLKFWTENLRDVQPLHLTLATPTDELLSPITEIESTIDVRPLKRFHTLISEAEATPFCGFFAAYNILLFKCSSQSSFAVGTVVDQRNIAQLANVVGFFANILPVKTYIDASQTFPQYLTSFKGDLLKSLENDDVAYEDILSHSGDPSPFGGYFRHMFTFSGLSLDAIEELELDGIQVRTIIPLPKVGDQSELSLTVHSSTGRVVLQFDNHLFSEETARMLLTAYVTLVKNLGRDSSVKIREVSATANEYDCLGVRLSRVGEGARAKLYTEKA